MRRWRAGDIVGSLLDLNNKRLTFYHNGRAISPLYDFFAHNESGFFAAASFMSFQQCRSETHLIDDYIGNLLSTYYEVPSDMFGSNRFNFGSRPFKFPPADTEFRSFNSEGSLSDEQRMILPRHMRLQLQVSSRNCGCSRVSFPHSNMML